MTCWWPWCCGGVPPDPESCRCESLPDQYELVAAGFGSGGVPCLYINGTFVLPRSFEFDEFGCEYRLNYTAGGSNFTWAIQTPKLSYSPGFVIASIVGPSLISYTYDVIWDTENPPDCETDGMTLDYRDGAGCSSHPTTIAISPVIP